MSVFNWFSRKPVPEQGRGSPGDDGQASAVARRDAGPGGRRSERSERREQLYGVVRDVMVRAGVLSASYKFKVLSLDQRGRQFLVMMDLAQEYGGDAARLSEIEALIAQTAKTRYDIAVNAVYWRLNDHVAVGIPQKGLEPKLPSAPVQAAPVAARPVVAAAPVPPARVAPVVAPVAAPARPAPAAPRFDPIEADEVAAFKQALAASARPAPAAAAPGVPVRSGPMRSVLLQNDFAETELPEDSRAQDLSGTQYGDL